VSTGPPFLSGIRSNKPYQIRICSEIGFVLVGHLCYYWVLRCLQVFLIRHQDVIPSVVPPALVFDKKTRGWQPQAQDCRPCFCRGKLVPAEAGTESKLGDGRVCHTWLNTYPPMAGYRPQITITLMVFCQLELLWAMVKILLEIYVISSYSCAR